MGWADPSSARVAVLRALKRLTSEPASELRNLQYQRLNEMLLTLWPKVQSGNTDSIRTAQGVMRDMNLLYGVDAPAKVEVEGVTTGSQNNVFVIGGDQDRYVANLKAAIGIVDPNKAKELLAADQFDTILDVESEIVEPDSEDMADE